jgi:bacterioferritin-associated ferredoxin
MVVCQCYAVNDRTIRAEIASGALDADDVAQRCGAGSRCGGCRTVVEELLHEQAPPTETLVRSLRVADRTLAA